MFLRLSNREIFQYHSFAKSQTLGSFVSTFIYAPYLGIGCTPPAQPVYACLYHGLKESGDSPGQPKTGYGRHIARNSWHTSLEK